MLQKTSAAKIVNEIKVLNACIAIQGKDYILRGVIDPECLEFLKVDDYQREVLSPTGGKRSELVKAIEDGVTLPDVELGMRGKDVKFIGTGDRAVAVLRDPVYIVDGLQRINAVKIFLDKNPEKSARISIGASIHLETDKKSEKERFQALNAKRVPVGPSILLRNMRDESPGLLTIYGLSMNDPEFALFKRVAWEQRMKKTELITGLMLVKAASAVHQHCGARGGVRGATSVIKVPPVLDRIVKGIGLQAFRENIKEFFEILDVCWGIRSIEYNTIAPQIRGNWLMVIGSILSDHVNFWQGKELFVDADMKRKFKSFPIHDSNINHLAGAGSMAIPILYKLVLDHMNKGRRINRLKPRKEPVSKIEGEEEGEA